MQGTAIRKRSAGSSPSFFKASGVLALALLFSCSKPEGPFSLAEKMDREGQHLTAIAEYDGFVRANPRDPLVAEAWFKTGLIYRDALKDFAKARAYFDRAANVAPEGPWAKRARAAAMDCPDYFPLDPGLRRVLGDSQSGGRYMRIEETVENVKDGEGRLKIKKRIFAGKQQVSSDARLYEKKDMELREYGLKGSRYATLLRYPLAAHTSWRTVKDGRQVVFTVEDDDVTVKVKGGTFTHCLKLREKSPSSTRSWKTHYFAPDIGLVLTGAATAKGESRMAELLSYQKAGG